MFQMTRFGTGNFPQHNRELKRPNRELTGTAKFNAHTAAPATGYRQGTG
jgi:hypothetical protein